MLQNISWGQYLQAIAVVLVFYYLLVAYRYYKTELYAFTAVKQTSGVQPSALQRVQPSKEQEEPFSGNTLEQQNTSSILTPLAESFRNEAEAYITQAGEIDTAKEEMLQSLKSIASKYPSLTTSSFRNYLEENISGYCRKYCSVDISTDELSSIWY